MTLELHKGTAQGNSKIHLQNKREKEKTMAFYKTAQRKSIIN